MAVKKLSTAQRKKLFVKYYRVFGSVGEACKEAGIASRKTVYLWIENDPKFAEVYQELKANRADQIKSKLFLCSQGQLALTSAQVTSGIFLLKAFDPKQFAEKYQFGGLDGGPITFKVVYDDSNIQ